MDANRALLGKHVVHPTSVGGTPPRRHLEIVRGAGVGSSDAVNVVKALGNGQVWISVRGKGIYAIQHDEDYTVITAVKNINTNNGSGLLPSAYVQTIAEDEDGEVWVGTENGFIIFYNPETVFGTSGFNGVQPVIQATDGNNEKTLPGRRFRTQHFCGRRQPQMDGHRTAQAPTLCRWTDTRSCNIFSGPTAPCFRITCSR